MFSFRLPLMSRTTSCSSSGIPPFPFPPSNLLHQNVGRSLVRCPMCREECIIPSGGVSYLPASFLINQLRDVLLRQRRDVVPSCSLHPQDGLLYCESCDHVFCPNCDKVKSVTLYFHYKEITTAVDTLRTQIS